MMVRVVDEQLVGERSVDSTPTIRLVDSTPTIGSGEGLSVLQTGEKVGHAGGESDCSAEKDEEEDEEKMGGITDAE
jgi:hypothetical protein